MVWKCPPLHLHNWNNFWKWKEDMKHEPRGVCGTFYVTVRYAVTVCAESEEDCWIKAEEIDPLELEHDDFVEHEITLKDGFEYDGF